MARILSDPVIGDYEVQLEVNKESGQLLWIIEDLLCHKSKQNDTVLIYFSGHGLLNDTSELLLATKNTDEKYRGSTTIPAKFIREFMNDCHAGRKIVILDSCHSGAFSGSMKGELDSSRRTRMELGSGVAILTASLPLQFSYEALANEAKGLSIFTRFLVEGLETGDATKTGDFIMVNDIYDYIRSKMKSLDLKDQKPSISTIGREGKIVIANNIASSKFALPNHVEALLGTNQPTSLKQIIPLLQQQINNQNEGSAKRAIRELQKLVNNTSQMVQGEAKKALDKANVSIVIPTIHFSNGKEIKSVAEWIPYVEQNKDIWLEASELLYSGLIEEWLTTLNQSKLADTVKTITDEFPLKRLIGLERFQRLAGGLPPQRRIDASTNLNQLIGQLIYWRLNRYRKTDIFEFEITNRGRGYMHGKLVSQVEWLFVDKPEFGCLTHDMATVQFTVDYDRYHIFKPYSIPLDFLLGLPDNFKYYGG
jgi:hypothetical protein